jgi:hypothetical protein
MMVRLSTSTSTGNGYSHDHGDGTHNHNLLLRGRGRATNTHPSITTNSNSDKVAGIDVLLQAQSLYPSSLSLSHSRSLLHTTEESVGNPPPPPSRMATLVEANFNEEDDTSTVTIKLHQALFGDETRCGPNANKPEDVALLMFAIYQKPAGDHGVFVSSGDTEEEEEEDNNNSNNSDKTCKAYFQKDACWSSEELVVACDVDTHLATVDVYTRDTYHLDRATDTVDNPHVPRRNNPRDPSAITSMCIGPRDTVGYTVKHTAIFECHHHHNNASSSSPSSSPSLPGNNDSRNHNGACETNDNCPSTQWCSEAYLNLLIAPDHGMLDATANNSPTRRVCKDYVAPKSECGRNTFTPPGLEDRCDPQEAACVDYSLSTGIIIGTLRHRCVAYEGACATHQDCEDDTNNADSYCDAAAGQCMAKRQLHDCCDDRLAPCGSMTTTTTSSTTVDDGDGEQYYGDTDTAGAAVALVCTDMERGVSTCQLPSFSPSVPNATQRQRDENNRDGGSCVFDTDCPLSQFCANDNSVLYYDYGEPNQLKACKDFAKVGRGCCAEGLIYPLPEARCDTNHSGGAGVVCVTYNSCFGDMADPFSRCVAYEGACITNQDCETLKSPNDNPNLYCNAASGQCMAKFKEGDCCNALTAPCEAPLVCVAFDSQDGSISTCRR